MGRRPGTALNSATADPLTLTAPAPSGGLTAPALPRSRRGAARAPGWHPPARGAAPVRRAGGKPAPAAPRTRAARAPDPPRVGAALAVKHDEQRPPPGALRVQLQP